MSYIDIDGPEGKIYQLESAIADLQDRIQASFDQVRIAQQTLSDCIDAALSAYVDDLGPVGEAFHNFAKQLRAAEIELGRAAGELVG